MPIDLEYPAGRVAYMLEDSEASIIITEKVIAEALKNYSPISPEEYRYSPDGLAYMIYTSGSTGKPKGVMIQHKALLNFVHFIRERWHLTDNSRITCHSNFAFDASVEDLYPALTVGGSVFIVPEDARRDIFEMRNFIAKHNINGGSYSTLFGQMLAADKEPLDVDYMCIGGEAMTAYPNVRGAMYNVYGPTEFTVGATYFELEKGKKYAPIPIGRPLYNCSGYIVDKYSRLLPQGMTGELCMFGPQLAEGYLNRPELTAEKFADLQLSENHSVKVYHTGELARYNEDGQIEYIGRIDFQVKLRGFRIELGEIEARAVQFTGVIHAVADVRKNTLCLYYTAAKEIDEEKLRLFIGEKLPEYMVPGICIRLEKMPMTPSGKINRKVLPVPDFSAQHAEYEAPKNDVERTLCDTFSQVLGLEKNSVGRNDDFFTLGGDSLKSMLVMTNSGIEGLSAKTIFKCRTSRRIAEEYSSQNRTDIDSYEERARTMLTPATSTQIYMIDYQFLNVKSTMFNIGGFYRFDTEMDAEKLAQSVDEAVSWHPVLSSVFSFDDEGNIVISYKPGFLKKTEVEDITADELETLTHTLMRPFRIFSEPLFRSKVFKCGGKVYLFIDIHHSISDGVSIWILLDDIARAYLGEAPVKDFYYSYLRKEYENLHTKETEAARQYFDNILANKDWCTMPTPDFDVFASTHGEEREDSVMTVEKISESEKRLGVSRNVIAITAAVLALQEYCGKDYIRVQYLSSNRTEEYLSDTVGLVFKLLPIAVNLNDFLTEQLLMSEINRQVAETIARSICDYGSEHNTLMEDALLINYIADSDKASEFAGFAPHELLLTSQYEASSTHADVYLEEKNGAVDIYIDYIKSCYSEGNMRRFLDMFVNHFKHIVNSD